MFELSWRNGLRVLRCQYRTISIVQYLRRRGAKQVPAEETGVCRHDDKIEFVRPGMLNDLCRRIARQQDSPGLSEWKFGLKERIEFLSSKFLLLFGNLGKRPYVELERIVTVEIEDVKQCHFGAEHSRGPLHVSCHTNAGRREVHREQNVLDHRHGFDSHSGFNNTTGPETRWILGLSLPAARRALVATSAFDPPRKILLPRLCSESCTSKTIRFQIATPWMGAVV